MVEYLQEASPFEEKKVAERSIQTEQQSIDSPPVDDQEIKFHSTS